MKELKNGRVKCDYCRKAATINIQSGKVEWGIDKTGKYSDNPTEFNADDDINAHLCTQHHDQYDNGTLDIF